MQKIFKKKLANQEVCREAEIFTLLCSNFLERKWKIRHTNINIYNEENLNLTESNDNFIRRIIEQVTVLSATLIRIWFVGGCEQDANPTLKK